MSKLSDYSEIPKAVVSRLQKLGINSLSQLIFHFPLRYLDETKIIRISDLRLGETAQVQAEVKLAEVIYKPRRTLLVKLSDGSGELYIRLLNFGHHKSFHLDSMVLYNLDSVIMTNPATL